MPQHQQPTHTAQTPAGRAVVIGVLGATGGLGASTFASVLAVRSARSGRSTVLIDGHPYGGGLDILLGLDVSPAWRWSDFSAAQGDLDAPAILAALPSLPGCHVLSWGRGPGSAIPNALLVCEGLSAEVEVSVIDLPVVGTQDCYHWWAMCDHIVMLCGSGVRQLASAAVVLEVLERADPTPAAPRVVGLLRQQHRGGADKDAASALLGIPLVATIETDRRLEIALRRGEALGMRNSPSVRACERVLLLLTSTRGAAA